ncbi:proline-rich protein 12-like isoform X2 [Lutra lutra]|uniref:proline-rich protein 12-like isoform X2 n=1 Tax=Lutra lutra TaxID=9657 RepID=UPI001FD37EF1|nr:proline-rich protein 12-like isoform X2 [Lutra lutra]
MTSAAVPAPPPPPPPPLPGSAHPATGSPALRPEAEARPAGRRGEGAAGGEWAGPSRLEEPGCGVAGGAGTGRWELRSRRSAHFSLLSPQSAHWFERLGLVTASARTFHTLLSGDRNLHRRTRALRAGRARPGRGAAEPPLPHLRSPLCSWRTGWRGDPCSLPCTHVPAQVSGRSPDILWPEQPPPPNPGSLGPEQTLLPFSSFRLRPGLMQGCGSLFPLDRLGKASPQR